MKKPDEYWTDMVAMNPRPQFAFYSGMAAMSIILGAIRELPVENQATAMTAVHAQIRDTLMFLCAEADDATD